MCECERGSQCHVVLLIRSEEMRFASRNAARLTRRAVSTKKKPRDSFALRLSQPRKTNSSSFSPLRSQILSIRGFCQIAVCVETSSGNAENYHALLLSFVPDITPLLRETYLLNRCLSRENPLTNMTAETVSPSEGTQPQQQQPAEQQQQAPLSNEAPAEQEATPSPPPPVAVTTTNDECANGTDGTNGGGAGPIIFKPTPPPPRVTSKQQQVMENEALRTSVTNAESALESLCEARTVNALASTVTKHTEAHQSAVETALRRVSWSEFAVGAFDEQYLHDLLQLTLAMEEMRDASAVPRYEGLTKAIERLTAMVDHPRTLEHFRAVAAATNERLRECERRFATSQVDIDTMNHASFFAAVDQVQSLTEQSLEYLVAGYDGAVDVAVTEYKRIAQAQMQQYTDDAAAVAAASAAKLRALRPEDEGDPWETADTAGDSAARAARRIQECDSKALREYFEQEEAARTTEIYEDEWYMRRRRDVDTLIPRAVRVVKEVDEEEYGTALKCLTTAMHHCREKGAVIDQTAKDTGAATEKALSEMKQRTTEIVTDGAAFLASCHDARVKCENDRATLLLYRERAAAADDMARTRHRDGTEEDVAFLRSNKASIDRLAAEIEERQRRMDELRSERAVLTNAALTRHDEEEQRASKHRVLMGVSATYLEKLEATLRNYVLPDAYNETLVDFAKNCESAAENNFQRQRALLASLLDSAVRQYAQFAATAAHTAEMGVMRKQAKVNDLLAKALTSQRQREFCQQTKDPQAPRHTTAESTLRNMATEVTKGIPALQEVSRECVEAFESVSALAQQLGIDVGTAEPSVLISNSLTAHREFVAKAPRMPLTTLDFTSTQRLLRPQRFFIDDSPSRARR